MELNMRHTEWPQGFWEVHDRRFINKFDALVYSTEINSPPQYNYFNHVWQNFDRKLIGQQDLPTLYRKRAQALREKYDYLILYFSGGADSYNVLRTFIDNGIKLDEVCVKWATKLTDKDQKYYIPNKDDITAYNYVSEWDFAIKPVLDSLAKNNPEIKINVVNWLDQRMVEDTTSLFKSVNHWHDIELPSLATWSPSEQTMISQGKTVGSIYGVDKPNVYFGKEECYMLFNDSVIAMGNPNPINLHGTELFYWAPEMPELAFEMAFRAASLFLSDPNFAAIKYTPGLKDNPVEMQRLYQAQQKQLRYKLYDNWIDSFQTQKPELLDRTDKQSWILDDPDLNDYCAAYYAEMSKHLARINPKLYRVKNNKKMYEMISTKPFFVAGYNSLIKS